MTRIRFMTEERAYKPTKGHYEDAGVDLRTPRDVVVPCGGSVAIDTGVMCNIPVGYYGKLESKSGLNVKYDIVSCGGVIDAGYTGHIVAKLYNFGKEDYEFKAGEKIVQIVFMPCVARFDGIEILDESERGTDGFGSTGA